jgi:uncharacterized protein YdaU (DUF1376 family)
MSETPFMPLWVSDFLGDTLELDAKEIGAYMLLLMAMWQHKGRLPNDQKKLQRVARIGRDWPKVWASLERYFDSDGDTISNQRLTKELHKVDAKRAVNAHSGARGGRAKALKNNGAPLANALATITIPRTKKETPSGVSKESAAKTEKTDDADGNETDSLDAGPGEDKPKSDDPPKPKPKRKRSATAKCGLDGNWEPDQSAIAYAEERGLDWQRTWEDFRDYHIKHGKQWAGAKGWLAAWQGWCRRQIEFDAKQNSRNSRHGGQSRAGITGQGDRENDPWHEAILARRAAGVGQFGEAIPLAGNGQPDDDGSEILFFGDYRSLGGS